MSHLKKLLLAVGATLTLSVGSAAWAVPSIQITDLTDGSPTVFTSAGIDLGAAGITLTPESASFDAILHIPFGVGVLNFSGAPSLFVLTELDGSVSDWLQITTPSGFGGSGAADWIQSIHVEFASDIDGIPLIPPAGTATCSLTETGLMQTCALFSQTGDEILDIGIQSDAADVPEPTTLSLIALSLVGLASRRRKSAKAQA